MTRLIVLASLSGLLWTMLVLVRAVRLPRAPYSAFELERRAAAGDEAAVKARQDEQAFPAVEALRKVLAIGLLVGAVTATLAAAGVWRGFLLALLGAVLVDRVAAIPIVERGAYRRFTRYRPEITAAAARLAWLTIRLQGRREVSGRQLEPFASREELVAQLKQSRGVLNDEEKAHLISGLRFAELTVREIMTPRSMVEAVDQEETIGPILLDRLHKTGHSRFPVMKGDIDHVVGMLYLHDLLARRRPEATVREAMQPDTFFIREDAPLVRALHGFLRSHHHLFIVVNEFRETVGVLSLEDVMEALLGRTIVDEFDAFDDLRAVAAGNPRANNQSKTTKDI